MANTGDQNTRAFYDALKAAWARDTRRQQDPKGWQAYVDGLKTSNPDAYHALMLQEAAGTGDYGNFQREMSLYNDPNSGFYFKGNADPQWQEILAVMRQDPADAVNRLSDLTGINFTNDPNHTADPNHLKGNFGKNIPIDANGNPIGPKTETQDRSQIDKELADLYGNLTGDLTKDPNAQRIMNQLAGSNAMGAAGYGGGSSGYSVGAANSSVAAGLGDYAKQRTAMATQVAGLQNDRNLGLGQLGLGLGQLQLGYAQLGQQDFVNKYNMGANDRANATSGLGAGLSALGNIYGPIIKQGIASSAGTPGSGGGVGGGAPPINYAGYNTPGLTPTEMQEQADYTGGRGGATDLTVADKLLGGEG